MLLPTPDILALLSLLLSADGHHGAGDPASGMAGHQEGPGQVRLGKAGHPGKALHQSVLSRHNLYAAGEVIGVIRVDCVGYLIIALGSLWL